MSTRHYVPLTGSPDWAAGVVANRKLMLGEQRRSMGNASFRNEGTVGKVWVDGGEGLLVCASGNVWVKGGLSIENKTATADMIKKYAEDLFDACAKRVQSLSAEHYVIAPVLLNYLTQHPAIKNYVTLYGVNYSYYPDSAGVGVMYGDNDGHNNMLWFSADVFSSCLEKHKEEKYDEILPYLNGLSTTFPDDGRLMGASVVAWVNGKEVMVYHDETELYTGVAVDCWAAVPSTVKAVGSSLVTASTSSFTVISDTPSYGTYPTIDSGTTESLATVTLGVLYPRRAKSSTYQISFSGCDWPVSFMYTPTLRWYYDYPSTGCTAWLCYITSSVVTGQSLVENNTLETMLYSTDGAFHYPYMPASDLAAAKQSRVDSVTYSGLFTWVAGCADDGPIMEEMYTSMSTNGASPRTAYGLPAYRDVDIADNGSTDYCMYLSCVDPEFMSSVGIYSAEEGRTKSIIFYGLTLDQASQDDILDRCSTFDPVTKEWGGGVNPVSWVREIVEELHGVSVYVYLA